MIRLGILGSTRGTAMSPIISAILEKKLDAEVAVVISNKSDALILEKAKNAEITAQFVDPTNIAREEYDEKVSKILEKHQIDLVILIGYMRILSKNFVEKWKNKIINVHPSLLPDFGGMMDVKVHEAVIAAGKKESGCTVHIVTEEVDGGPIVLQKKCAVYETDTAEVLKARVQLLEADALVEAIKALSSRDNTPSSRDLFAGSSSSGYATLDPANKSRDDGRSH